MTPEEQAYVEMLRIQDDNPGAVDVTLLVRVDDESIRFWRSIFDLLPSDFPVLRLWDRNRDVTYVLDKSYEVVRGSRE